MKQFFAFVKKEFFHIWRDKRTLFILLGMPITQIIIFGFALTNEVKNSKMAVLQLQVDEKFYPKFLMLHRTIQHLPELSDSSHQNRFSVILFQYFLNLSCSSENQHKVLILYRLGPFLQMCAAS